MLCLGLTSVGRWEFLASSSFSPVPSSWSGNHRRNWRGGGGDEGSSCCSRLWPRCGASCSARQPGSPPHSGLEAKPLPPPPRPPRVLPKLERQRPGSPLGEAASAQARPLARSRAPAASVAPRGWGRHGVGGTRARAAWGARSRRGEGGAGEARQALRRRWGEGTAAKGHHRRAQVPCP